jgi:3-phytase
MRISLILFQLLFLAACQNHPINPNAKIVYAQVETQPVDSSDDAADDPAIWVNTKKPESSLILGTDKRKGLAVYDLKGKQVQFLSRGRLNNVDLRQGVLINNQTLDIAVATNRTNQSLDIFSINSAGEVIHVAEQALTIADPYGVCMYLDRQGVAHAFVNGKEGEYQQWQLNTQQSLSPKLIGQFQLASQPEGCSVNDKTGMLYLGEEGLGVWKMPANAKLSEQKQLIDSVANGNIVADVEGMDIYSTDTQTLLVVSSQGDHSYAIYDLRNENRYLGSFRIADDINNNIDGTQETDGLTVTSVNLGTPFTKGLLVVQDGFNELPKENQNFKLIDWQQIIRALDL